MIRCFLNCRILSFLLCLFCYWEQHIFIYSSKLSVSTLWVAMGCSLTVYCCKGTSNFHLLLGEKLQYAISILGSWVHKMETDALKLWITTLTRSVSWRWADGSSGWESLDRGQLVAPALLTTHNWWERKTVDLICKYLRCWDEVLCLNKVISF